MGGALRFPCPLIGARSRGQGYFCGRGLVLYSSVSLLVGGLCISTDVRSYLGECSQCLEWHLITRIVYCVG